MTGRRIAPRVAIVAGIQSAGWRNARMRRLELRGEQTLASRSLIEAAGTARQHAKSHADGCTTTPRVAISVDLAR